MQRYMILVKGGISSSPDSAKPKVIGLIECTNLSSQNEPAAGSKGVSTPGADVFSVRPFPAEHQSWRDNRDACTIFKYRNLHYLRFNDSIAVGEASGTDERSAAGGVIKASAGSLHAASNSIYMTLNSTRYSIYGNDSKVLFGGVFRAHYPTLEVHYGVGGIELFCEARIYANLGPGNEVLVDFYSQNFQYSTIYSQRALAYEFLFSGHTGYKPEDILSNSGGQIVGTVSGRASPGGAPTAGPLSSTSALGAGGDNALEHIIYYNYEDILTAVAVLRGTITSVPVGGWEAVMGEISTSLPVEPKTSLDVVILMSPKMEEERARINGNPNRCTITTGSFDAQIVIGNLAGPQFVVVSGGVTVSGSVGLKVGGAPFRVMPKGGHVRVQTGQVLLVLDKYMGIVVFKEDQPAMQISSSGGAKATQTMPMPTAPVESSSSYKAAKPPTAPTPPSAPSTTTPQAPPIEQASLMKENLKTKSSSIRKMKRKSKSFTKKKGQSKTGNKINSKSKRKSRTFGLSRSRTNSKKMGKL